MLRCIIFCVVCMFTTQCTTDVIGTRVEKGPRKSVYKLQVYTKNDILFADITETFSESRTKITESVVKGNMCTAKPIEWAFMTAFTFGIGVFACFGEANQQITTTTSEDEQEPLTGFAPLRNAVIDGQIIYPNLDGTTEKNFHAMEAWPASGIRISDDFIPKRMGIALRVGSTDLEKILNLNCAVKLDGAGNGTCYSEGSMRNLESGSYWYKIQNWLENDTK